MSGRLSGVPLPIEGNVLEAFHTEAGNGTAKRVLERVFNAAISTYPYDIFILFLIEGLWKIDKFMLGGCRHLLTLLLIIP